jgi:hypothetical protein
VAEPIEALPPSKTKYSFLRKRPVQINLPERGTTGAAAAGLDGGTVGRTGAAGNVGNTAGGVSAWGGSFASRSGAGGRGLGASSLEATGALNGLEESVPETGGRTVVEAEEGGVSGRWGGPVTALRSALGAVCWALVDERICSRIAASRSWTLAGQRLRSAWTAGIGSDRGRSSFGATFGCETSGSGTAGGFAGCGKSSARRRASVSHCFH